MATLPSAIPTKTTQRAVMRAMAQLPEKIPISIPTVHLSKPRRIFILLNPVAVIDTLPSYFPTSKEKAHPQTNQPLTGGLDAAIHTIRPNLIELQSSKTFYVGPNGGRI